MNIIKISQNGQTLPDVKLTNNQGDTAFTLPIKNIYEGCGFILTFSNFETDGVTPKNWPTATYSLAISPDQGGDRTIMLIAPTVTGNLITIGVNDSQNILKAGIKYHWDLLVKPEVGDSWMLAKGVIEAMQTRSRKLTVTNVSVTGQQVVVLTDYYTKEEMNAKLEELVVGSVDLSGYYTKQQVDDIIAALEVGGGDLTNYYNKTETNSLLTGKANATHTHGISDVTGLEGALDGKAASGHTHPELHTHSNKSVLDNITNAGDGTAFLANDGTYKTVSSGGGTVDTTIIDGSPNAVSGNAVHDALQSKVNTDDARLSDARTPTAHTHTAANITDFQTTVSANTDVAANTTARHSHSNKALLDTYTQTEVNLADAVSKKHSHSNQTTLDAVSGTNTGDETGASIKTKLEGLSGDNRVDASAIKNLPTGGSAPTLAQMILAGEHFNHFHRIGDFDTISSGAGAFTNAFIAGKEGVGQLSSGNTATSRLAIMRSAGAVKNHQMSGVARVYQTSIMIPTLSNTTDEYVVIAGWHDNNNGSTPTSNQLAFVYDRAATGDFWTTKAKVNGGATASVTTGIAVVAGQWYTLKIELNRDGTEAKFYIDGALIDTKTTAFSTSNATYLILGIFKSVGTTARLVNSDYWYEKFDMNLS